MRYPTIERLADELELARRAVAEALSTGPLGHIFNYSTIYSLHDEAAVEAWWEQATGAVLAFAGDRMEAHNRMAPCPLCGSVSTAPYSTGFTVPLGLERHLFGGGNAAECFVVRQLRDLTWGKLRRRRQFEEEQREREESDRRRAAWQAEQAARRTDAIARGVATRAANRAAKAAQQQLTPGNGE